MIWRTWGLVLLFIAVGVQFNHDVNPEAAISELSADALVHKPFGRLASEYFRDRDVKERYGDGVFTFAGTRAVDCLEYSVQHQPLAILCIYPFVCIMGYSYWAHAVHAWVFSGLAVLLLYLIGRRMYGEKTAWLACVLLLLCPTWVIHMKVNYTPWFPSVVVLEGVVLAALNSRFRIACALTALSFFFGWITVVFTGGFLLAWMAAHKWSTERWLRGLKVGLLTGVIFTGLYCVYFLVNPIAVHEAIWDIMFERFAGGEPGVIGYSFLEKVQYGLKCLFVDGQTYDPHQDKFIHGYPAVSFLCTALLPIGLWRMFVRRQWTILSWVGVVMVVLLLGFNYSHRYALLLLPALCLVGAVGWVWLVEWYSTARWALCVFVLLFIGDQLYGIHVKYYNRPVELEFHRLQGHYNLAQKIKALNLPEKTVIVLSDRVMFSDCVFLMHYGRPATFWKPGLVYPISTVYVMSKATGGMNAFKMEDYNVLACEDGVYPMYVFTHK